MLYALVGENSKELLSYNGMTIVHNHKGELEFLVTGAKVIPCPKSVPKDQMMSIKLHPDLSHVRWPLKRKDFR